MKNENKTKPTSVSVAEFIASVPDPKRADAERLLTIMKEISGEPAVMWGPTMIGFGQYHYKYASGREGDYFAAGFAPRKAALTIYLLEGMNANKNLLQKLGPHKTGKGCLYIKRLSDIDESVLRELIVKSYDYVKSHSIEHAE
ncbi:MAG TPA: DUF1801 domain-containing protein [Magnetospirillaceae bacterium]|nr:DUF1801 domain-containing protein [Magnetospirillaceae bacterium]